MIPLYNSGVFADAGDSLSCFMVLHELYSILDICVEKQIHAFTHFPGLKSNYRLFGF